MKLSFSIAVWKYALLTLNVLVSVLGVILISVGVVTLGGAGSPLGAYLATGLGSIVLTLCSLGCFAALRESYALSMAYLGFGAFTVVCETIYMISFAAMKSDYIDMTRQRVQDTWELELSSPGAMFSIQTQYECCGKDSPQDYIKDNKLPSSCCILKDCSSDNNIFTKGCENMAVKFIDCQSDNLILTLVGLVALEALAMISSYYLAKSLEARGVKSEQIVISE
ncbi:tetraspanin-9 [Calliphora vicina]|uniref:tetraspanin-9 n=1 Tax=Calliphora vicina TaxID=7373 RepID=UPI00325C2332